MIRGPWHAVGRCVFDGTRLVCTVEADVPFAAEIAFQLAKMPEALRRHPDELHALEEKIDLLASELEKLEEALVEAETAAGK